MQKLLSFSLSSLPALLEYSWSECSARRVPIHLFGGLQPAPLESYHFLVDRDSGLFCAHVAHDVCALFWSSLLHCMIFHTVPRNCRSGIGSYGEQDYE